MGCAEAGNLALRLRPSRCGARMCVRDASDAGKGAIENKVSRKVGRWPESALDDLAVEINDDEVVRLHVFIGNAARLNHHQPLAAFDTTGVAKGIEHQATAHEFQICFEYFVAQTLQDHAFPLAAEAILRRLGRTPPA